MSKRDDDGDDADRAAATARPRRCRCCRRDLSVISFDPRIRTLWFLLAL